MSKVWFITGSSSGIGLATVKAALASGHRVVATSRSLPKLTAALAEGPQDSLLLLDLDVRDGTSAKRAVDQAVEKFGTVDVLVNNAGYSLMGTMESFSAAHVEEQMDTNFMGVVHVLYAVLPIMRQQKAGRIFNISSVAGRVGIAGCSAYAASKFAVEGLSLALAEEVRGFNIHVTLIEPGFFRTELLSPSSAIFGTTKVAGYQDPDELKKAWSGYHGKQPGQPESLAKTILQLAEAESPPTQFLAGGDAVDAIEPDLQRRLAEIKTHVALSRSASGPS